MLVAPGSVAVGAKTIVVTLQPAGTRNERLAYGRLLEVVNSWRLSLPRRSDATTLAVSIARLSERRERSLRPRRPADIPEAYCPSSSTWRIEGNATATASLSNSDSTTSTVSMATASGTSTE